MSPVRTYTVDRVSPETEEFQGQGGPMVAFRVMFREHPEKPVRWNKKKENAEKFPPKPGMEVQGTVDWEDKFGPKFTQHFDFDRAQKSSAAGRSPEESARIQWQHSQDMSIQAVRLACDLGVIRPESLAALFDVIDSTTLRFQRDIERGPNMASYGNVKPEERKDIERTGESDVPSRQQEFTHSASPHGDDADIPF